jgi:hypothetical protein
MSRLRVVGHVHSAWSYDGSWALEDLSREFARRGFDAVLMAEHDRTFDTERWETYRTACAAASAAGALLVPGIEYSDAEDRVHVPVWGAGAFLGAARPTGELLEDARARGALAVVAHPGRRDVWRTADPAWGRLAWGVEIWNRKYDGWAPGAGGCDLQRRWDLPAFVGLDFHTAKQFAPLGMVGCIDGPVDEAAVVDALRDGRLTPKVARVGAAHFTAGGGLRAARGGERMRRGLARHVRSARARLRRATA